MHLTVSRTLYITHLIPPRCRTPRGGYLTFPITCTIADADASALQHVADILTHRSDGPQQHRLSRHPAHGFLTRLEITPGELPAHLGDRPEPRAIASRDVPGQALSEIQAARQETQARAAALAIIDEAVYEHTPEPVYQVRYEPSVNWEILSLTVRPAPRFSEADYGTSDRWGAVPPLARLFNARHRRQAEALLERIASRTAERRDIHRDLERSDRITALIPEAFTFDADQWHTTRERLRTQQQLQKLLTDFARPFPDEDISALLYPKRLALAAWLRRVVTDLPPLPSGERA